MERFNLRAAPLVMAFAAAITTACGGGGGGGLVDNTPPTVVTTDPPSNAVGVQLNDPIIATFSEPLDPASVSVASFQVTDDMSNPVNGIVSVSGRDVRFTPAPNALVKSALYHAMLTTGITDLAGNALATAFSWDFTTDGEHLGIHSRQCVNPNSSYEPYGNMDRNRNDCVGRTRRPGRFQLRRSIYAWQSGCDRVDAHCEHRDGRSTVGPDRSHRGLESARQRDDRMGR